jgi:hypothetical protein
MKSLQSLLKNVQAIELKEDVKLALLLESADEQSRAVIEAGAALLAQQGLEVAATFVSANMDRLLRATRASMFQAVPEVEFDLAA